MTKKYGFLFGAGAELAYMLPSGGQFALDIFRYDSSEAKREFKQMLENVDQTTSYANDWLPEKYRDKNVGTFGKRVFESIISSTVEHNRSLVIKKVNAFDETAMVVAEKNFGDDVKAAFYRILDREVSNIKLSQSIEYNKSFNEGNQLFESNYFSALLLVYKKWKDDGSKSDSRAVLKRILLSVMQLHIGALSEDFSRSINDNLFEKKDDEIDLFDDFGELIRINYMAAGVSGLELLLDRREYDTSTDEGIILSFAKKLIENIYASVLDYKTLIDANWHNLYCPRADWAKFCKIAIFLLTVEKYISKIGKNANTDNPNGYYNMLKDCLDSRKYEATAIATTNYNSLIEEILECEVTYLNGSTLIWYDPYLNKVGAKAELEDSEHHIVVPLIFTQSGTKPMTAISMSTKYVDLYRKWKDSDAIVVSGFGFGSDDEHINGILRTLVNDDGKQLIIVTKDGDSREKAKTLRINDAGKINVIVVDDDGKVNGKRWVDLLYEDIIIATDYTMI